MPRFFSHRLLQQLARTIGSRGEQKMTNCLTDPLPTTYYYCLSDKIKLFTKIVFRWKINFLNVFLCFFRRAVQCDQIWLNFATLAKVYKSLTNFWHFSFYLAILVNLWHYCTNLTIWSHWCCFWSSFVKRSRQVVIQVTKSIYHFVQNRLEKAKQRTLAKATDWKFESTIFWHLVFWERATASYYPRRSISNEVLPKGLKETKSGQNRSKTLIK